MQMRGVAAVTAILLLAACRQAEENQANAVATNSSAVSPNPAAATVTAGQAQQIFHERHEGMEDIGKATKAIGEQLKSDSPDVAVIRKSGATISDLAAKSANWFPAGTGQDVLHKTRALPAIWEKPQDFAAKDRDFRTAAQAFDSAAASGNLEAIRSSFDTLGDSCKACHDTYRAKHHPK